MYICYSCMYFRSYVLDVMVRIYFGLTVRMYFWFDGTYVFLVWRYVCIFGLYASATVRMYFWCVCICPGTYVFSVCIHANQKYIRTVTFPYRSICVSSRIGLSGCGSKNIPGISRTNGHRSFRHLLIPVIFRSYWSITLSIVDWFNNWLNHGCAIRMKEIGNRLSFRGILTVLIQHTVYLKHNIL